MESNSKIKLTTIERKALQNARLELVQVNDKHLKIMFRNYDNSKTIRLSDVNNHHNGIAVLNNMFERLQNVFFPQNLDKNSFIALKQAKVYHGMR